MNIVLIVSYIIGIVAAMFIWRKLPYDIKSYIGYSDNSNLILIICILWPTVIIICIGFFLMCIYEIISDMLARKK